jgi:hypothetical protein
VRATGLGERFEQRQPIHDPANDSRGAVREPQYKVDIGHMQFELPMSLDSFPR